MIVDRVQVRVASGHRTPETTANVKYLIPKQIRHRSSKYAKLCRNQLHPLASWELGGQAERTGLWEAARQIKISTATRLVGGIVGADADDERHLGDNRARRKNTMKPLGTSGYVRAHSGPKGEGPKEDLLSTFSKCQWGGIRWIYEPVVILGFRCQVQWFCISHASHQSSLVPRT